MLRSQMLFFILLNKYLINLIAHILLRKQRKEGNILYGQHSYFHQCRHYSTQNNYKLRLLRVLMM